MCDKCKKDLNDCLQIYQIPLDSLFKAVSGNFCSIPCARFANRMVNDPPRFIENWVVRDKWMLDRYFTKEPKNNKVQPLQIKKKIK